MDSGQGEEGGEGQSQTCSVYEHTRVWPHPTRRNKIALILEKSKPLTYRYVFLGPGLLESPGVILERRDRGIKDAKKANS